MAQEILRIKLALPYRLGSVNCYLIRTDTGYVLVDTGSSNKRKELEEALTRTGCEPGNLNLIIITHGDFDHTGNAAYIRKKFRTKIAMHSDDSPMVEHGNMFLNRKKGNIFLKLITNNLFGFRKSQRFKPDLEVTDGFDLNEYGLNAKVIHIPGHSKGSIAIITVDGELICGDLLVNSDKIDDPKINTIIDDLEAADRSVIKLQNLEADMVFPGHGKPFKMSSLLENRPS